MDNPNKIIHWTIKYTTSDGKEHYVNDIPNYVATNVDEFLSVLEEEANNCDYEDERKCNNE